MMQTTGFPAGRLLLGLAVLLALTLSGCGGTGEVSGIVRFKGKPLPTGRITFTSQADRNATAFAWIGQDGSYKVSKCPAGRVNITVQTAVPHSGHKYQGTKPGSGAGPTTVTIPARYTDPTTTSLDYVVNGGQQTHDIDLTQ
jgi:hypothetical protein